MPPALYLLIAVVLLTLAVTIPEFLRRGRTHCALRQLAVERHLHFSRRDQLRLTLRVAGCLPVPGAAFVRIYDLLYGTAGGMHRYVFTAEYTVGAVRWKKRVRRAATFSEPKETKAAAAQPCAIQLAPAELSLVEQYRALLG